MTDRRRYLVRIKRSAEKEMDALPARIHDRVARAILALEANPRPHGVVKLQGIEQYRLRSGEYRILYTINDRARAVEIVAVGHRREVYRRL